MRLKYSVGIRDTEADDTATEVYEAGREYKPSVVGTIRVRR